MAQQYTNLIIDENTGIASVVLDNVSFSKIDYANNATLPISQPKVAPKNSQYSPEGGTSKNLIFDAVNIDWNGATPGIGEGTNGITTTGELLSLIKAIHTKANGSYASSTGFGRFINCNT